MGLGIGIWIKIGDWELWIGLVIGDWYWGLGLGVDEIIEFRIMIKTRL